MKNVNKFDKRLGLAEGVSLIIPALNEEKTIENVIERCSKQNVVCQIVVVNDGSTDKTKEVLSKIQEKWGVNKTGLVLTVIHHPKNMGKGVGIKSGLKQVKGKYVMVQDADLEYYPEEIIDLYKLAVKSKDGIVFGTRSHNRKKGYLLAQLGNWYLNNMFNILFGLKLTDAYTCYKLMPNTVWQKLNLLSNGFEIDSELIGKLGKTGHEIVEIPISYSPRKYHEGKKIKWIDALKATNTALKIRFRDLVS